MTRPAHKPDNTKIRLQEAVSQPRALGGTPDAPNRSSSENGLQEASFEKDGDNKAGATAVASVGEAV
jgi:hypothetical protein